MPAPGAPKKHRETRAGEAQAPVGASGPAPAAHPPGNQDKGEPRHHPARQASHLQTPSRRREARKERAQEPAGAPGNRGTREPGNRGTRLCGRANHATRDPSSQGARQPGDQGNGEPRNRGTREPENQGAGQPGNQATKKITATRKIAYLVKKPLHPILSLSRQPKRLGGLLRDRMGYGEL